VDECSDIHPERSLLSSFFDQNKEDKASLKRIQNGPQNVSLPSSHDEHAWTRTGTGCAADFSPPSHFFFRPPPLLSESRHSTPYPTVRTDHRTDGT
jgi:hypothetical protein